ncbi:MAG: helix-turn-helix domain-containing protein, partial [Gemmatimonadaceae bacterium]
VPPLRERLEDIPALVSHYLERFAVKLGKPLRSVSAGSLKLLQSYSWPGNIRELQNVIERACVLATSPIVEIHDPALAPLRLHHEDASELLTIDDAERAHIRRVLDTTSGRIDGPGGAAKILGVPPSTLRSRMQKLGILNRTSPQNS